MSSFVCSQWGSKHHKVGPTFFIRRDCDGDGEYSPVSARRLQAREVRFDRLELLPGDALAPRKP